MNKMKAAVVLRLLTICSLIQIGHSQSCQMPVPGVAYTLINNNFNCVMDTASGLSTIGNKIISYVNSNRGDFYNQQWYIGMVPGTTNYVILNAKDDLALDATGNVITQQTLTCDIAQQITLETDASCNFYIHMNPPSGNTVLSNVGQKATCKDSTAYLSNVPKTSATSQQWKIVPTQGSTWLKVFANCPNQPTTTAPPLPTLAPTTSTTPKATLAPMTPTTTTAILTATGTPLANCTVFDFTSQCLMPNSFYWAGICYTYNSADTYSGAQLSCGNTNANLAKIRSDDVAEQMYNFAQSVDGAFSGIWIQPLDSNGYTIFNNSISSDGTFVMKSSVVGGLCTSLTPDSSTGNLFWISDSSDSSVCIQRAPFFCETLPTFVQKGCNNQALSRTRCVVSYTKTMATVDACALECTMQIWCTGINYNQGTQVCEILADNSAHQQVVCDPNWAYFERVMMS